MPSLATTLQGPLGCGNYSVRLVNDGQPILAPRKVTTVLWGRRLDEASNATITIPVAGTDLRACCVGGNRIETLRTEVIISRNGLDVWQGWLLPATKFRRDTITIEATEPAKSFLADKGYDLDYGARPLRRVIQNEVEDKLSDGFLSGKFKEGDKILIDLLEGNLDFRAVMEPEKMLEAPMLA